MRNIREELIAENKDYSKLRIVSETELINSSEVFDEGYKFGSLVSITPNYSRLLRSPRIKKLFCFHYEIFSFSLSGYEIFDDHAFAHGKISKSPTIIKDHGFEFELDQEKKGEFEQEISVSNESLIADIEEVKNSDIDTSIISEDVSENSLVIDKVSVIEMVSGERLLWDESQNMDILDEVFISSSISEIPEVLDIESTKIVDINPGDAILIFAKGSSEYLDSEAEKLNINYPSIKKSRNEWKDKCKKYIEESSLDFLENNLRYDLGKITYRLNDWIYGESSPESKEHFQSLLTVIGFSSERSLELWENTKEYRNLRKAAGRSASKAIKNSINKEHIISLSENGKAIYFREFYRYEVHAFVIDEIRSFMPTQKNKLGRLF